MSNQVSESLLSRLRIKFNDLINRMNVSSGDVVRLVTCFGTGFVLGWLLRRYSKYVMLCLIGSILLLSALHYYEFIDFNVEKIKMLLGLQGVETVNALCQILVLYTKQRTIEFLMVTIGCILGFKVG